MKKVFGIILLLSVILPFSLKGQTILDKRISAHYNNQTISKILFDLQSKTGVHFSYSSSIIKDDKQITLSFNNQTLNQILQSLFCNDQISFFIIGNQIILKKKDINTHHNQSQNKLKFNIKETSNRDTAKPKSSFYAPESIKMIEDSSTVITPWIEKENSQSNNSNDTLVKSILRDSMENVKATIIKASSNQKNVFHRGYRENLSLIKFSKKNYTRNQFAILNVGKNIIGSQVGIINIAKTVSDKQIGLINICKKGYNKIEIWVSSELGGSIAFKSGTRKFYNIFAFGGKPTESFDDIELAIGYGIGREFKINDKVIFNGDNILYQVKNRFVDFDGKINILNQFRFNLGYKLTKSIIVFLGPELNLSLLKQSNHFSKINTQKADDDAASDYIPTANNANSFHSHTQSKIGFGINAGIRF